MPLWAKMLLTTSLPSAKNKRQCSVVRFRGGSVSFTAMNCIALFPNWGFNGQSFQYVFVHNFTNMHALAHSVTGGIGRRWCGYCRTKLEVRIKRQRSEYVSNSDYCLLYKRTSKERRKGNPPTPSTLSLYTIRLPPLEPFSILRCTIRILSHDLTHHSIIAYRNNHAISSDVATLLTTSLSY